MTAEASGTTIPAAPLPGREAFTHDEPGTDEATWFLDPMWDDVAAIDVTGLPLDGIDHVVVVSAHPDDETLGIGGTIAALSDAGVPLVLVLATAGEACNPLSGDWTPHRVAEVRLAEWTAAMAVLAPGARRMALGLPDGGVASAAERLREALWAEVTPRSLVLAPWLEDGHPDHEATGRIAAAVAQERGARCLHHVIWWWHWNRPERVRNLVRQQGTIVEPGPAAIHRKTAALDLFQSQLRGFGPGPEHGPVVTEQVIARGRRPFELLLGVKRPPTPAPPPQTAYPAEAASTFDAMYDAGDDPWHWEGSWYEQRRRALVLALLQRRSYHHVLEVGCATGLVTTDLSTRADAVTALDASARALAVARRRGLDNVTWVHATVPDHLPPGPFDAVVVSEVAYFLTPTALLALLRGIRERLTTSGEVIFVDWRAPSTGIPLDGPLVHELVDHCLGLPSSCRYADADVLAECWSTSPSPATTEELV